MIEVVKDALAGVRRGRDHREAIQRNLDIIAAMERGAVRITSGEFGRCFETRDGVLRTIRNEQGARSPFLHYMYVTPISRADAEDFYGWTPPEDDASTQPEMVP